MCIYLAQIKEIEIAEELIYIHPTDPLRSCSIGRVRVISREKIALTSDTHISAAENNYCRNIVGEGSRCSDDPESGEMRNVLCRS